MDVIRDTERRKNENPYLTEHELEELATRAADKAVEKITKQIYQSVGQSIIHKLFWLVGAVAVGFAAWLHSKGFFN